MPLSLFLARNSLSPLKRKRKQNGTRDAIAKLLAGLAAAAPSTPPDVDVVVAPPFLHLSAAVEALARSVNAALPAGAAPWAVAAQDMANFGSHMGS